jgi:hypothetical protein
LQNSQPSPSSDVEKRKGRDPRAPNLKSAIENLKS